MLEGRHAATCRPWRTGQVLNLARPPRSSRAPAALAPRRAEDGALLLGLGLVHVAQLLAEVKRRRRALVHVLELDQRRVVRLVRASTAEGGRGRARGGQRPSPRAVSTRSGEARRPTEMGTKKIPVARSRKDPATTDVGANSRGRDPARSDGPDARRGARPAGTAGRGRDRRRERVRARVRGDASGNPRRARRGRASRVETRLSSASAVGSGRRGDAPLVTQDETLHVETEEGGGGRGGERVGQRPVAASARRRGGRRRASAARAQTLNHHRDGPRRRRATRTARRAREARSTPEGPGSIAYRHDSPPILAIRSVAATYARLKEGYQRRGASDSRMPRTCRG